MQRSRLLFQRDHSSYREKSQSDSTIPFSSELLHFSFLPFLSLSFSLTLSRYPSAESSLLACLCARSNNFRNAYDENARAFSAAFPADKATENARFSGKGLAERQGFHRGHSISLKCFDTLRWKQRKAAPVFRKKGKRTTVLLFFFFYSARRYGISLVDRGREEGVSTWENEGTAVIMEQV